MKIGFIGTGVMGNPMCSNLLASGDYTVYAFDVDPAKTQNLGEQGAIVRNSASEVAADAELLFTSLPGPKQIEPAALGEQGFIHQLGPNTTWVDLSTNNLEVCNRIVEHCKQKGIGFLDCPVSGGDEGARAGTLTMLVGGDRELFEQHQAVLQIMGKNIQHLGANGAGYSAKISQVVLCYLHSLALSEALMLGIKGGVNPRQMLEIIRGSTGSSYVADRYGPPILNGDYDPSFTVGLAHKDMKLAQEMAENLGITLPMCDLTTTTYARAIEEFGFDANHLKAVRLLEQDNQTFLQAEN